MAEALLRRRFSVGDDIVVGEVFAVWDNIAPTPSSGTFVRLTAGESGSGGYNQGLLGSESVSGSAPLVQATAQVLVGPMSGQTVRLVNTERSFLRGGSSGVYEADAIQTHAHSRSVNGTTGNRNGQGGGANTARNNTWTMSVNAANSGNRGNETRPKNVGVTYYLRVQ